MKIVSTQKRNTDQSEANSYEKCNLYRSTRLNRHYTGTGTTVRSTWEAFLAGTGYKYTSIPIYEV